MSRNYTQDEQHIIDTLLDDIAIQLKDKPKRLRHSISVSDTAARLAVAYGADRFVCQVAGILHDWDKATDKEKLNQEALALGIDLGVDIGLVQPLLHGLVSAIKLKDKYPYLSDEVFNCIKYHTIGGPNLSDCEKIVFIADAIEPLRGDIKPIQDIRDLVGKVSLDELYFKTYTMGMIYVIETGRYLWPGTIDIYNKIVLQNN